MSEYWKSTPKYWCKFCETFVRDTVFERKQHEATGKHQGAIQRNLRKLHKDQERSDREKQRAKDEVSRLNALVSGESAASPSKAAPPKPTYTEVTRQQATPEERKRQLAQLAAMGIQVPEEYRGEMAMAGEWKTISQKAVTEKQGGSAGKLPASTATDRKRKHEAEDDEEQQVYRRKGLSQKVYPGSREEGEDLDTLLSAIVPKKEGNSPVVKAEEPGIKEEPAIKQEDDQQESMAEPYPAVVSVKAEDDGSEPGTAQPGSGIVFKKRKKPLRTK